MADPHRWAARWGNMEKSIYLETTLFNAYFDLPLDRQIYTREIFRLVKEGQFTAFTSNYVITELSAEVDTERKNEMLALMNCYPITNLAGGEDEERLAKIYMSEEIFP
ncbi:MAG: hypothetical protein LBT68_02215, partial [Spirochaetales bacterium]|nr:hypothetical protein [Spirochaetales bacterium]